MAVDRFPLGIATGPAFCNRHAERARLATSIETARHTWLLAPRRYGKTSLIAQVVEDTQAHGAAAATVDLLVAYDVESVRDAILEGVGRLTAQLMPLHRQALQRLRDFFASLRPEIAISDRGAEVRFTPGPSQPDQIIAALEGLDRLAADQGRAAVLVLDEFQQVGTLHHSAPLEAAIRHAVERARRLCYLFSGSRRHLLAAMFEDPARPLYHLCERLPLARITAEDYRPFLAEAADERWGTPLSEAAFEAIMASTARHPYYVNLLCGRLWRQPAPPSAQTVAEVWAAYVEEEKPRIAAELADLSPNQRAVLAAVAESPTDQPQGKAFLQRTRLAAASAGQAVKVLLNRDLLLEAEDGTLHVLDPAIGAYLRR